MEFSGHPNPVILYPLFGILITFFFLPQVILILAVSSAIAFFSKQVSFKKIILGILGVAVSVSYLVFTPMIMLDWPVIGQPPLPEFMKTQLFWEVESILIYLVASFSMMRWYWKLHGKLLIKVFLPVMTIIFIMILTRNI